MALRGRINIFEKNTAKTPATSIDTLPLYAYYMMWYYVIFYFIVLGISETRLFNGRFAFGQYNIYLQACRRCTTSQ